MLFQIVLTKQKDTAILILDKDNFQFNLNEREHRIGKAILNCTAAKVEKKAKAESSV